MSYQRTITPDQRRDFEERRRFEAQARREEIEAEARRRTEESRKAAEQRERADLLNARVPLKLDPIPNYEPDTTGLPENTARSMRDVSIQALQIRMRSTFDAWAKKHPEFEDTPENRGVIAEFLGHNKADVSERNLNACLPLFNKETVKPKYTEAELNSMSGDQYKKAMGLKAINSQDSRAFNTRK
jgi:hypothetical protein